MKKNAKSMESSQTQDPNPHVIPEDSPVVKEYQRLKARNEWIQMNQKYLDQIKNKQLFFHRAIFWLVVINLIVSLISLWPCVKDMFS